MKNILSVKAQERSTQNRLLHPSAMRRAPKADSPPKRCAPSADYPTHTPKADCPSSVPCAKRRVPIFLE